MKCLIDADNLAFACAASAENEDVWVACKRAEEMVGNVLADTKASEYELWLTGKGNFRHNIYPEYKATRIGAYRPKWEKEVKAFLTESFQANWSEGCEADDMLGVRLTELGDKGIMAHLDKDMNMIPGWHFNWEMKRLGKIVREKRTYYVTPEEAYRFFCYQLLIGDTTDNIKGVSGIGPKKAEALLDNVPQSGWYEAIRDYYASEEELDLNASCLYIWRKPNDSWRNLIGLKADENHSSSLSSEVEPDVGRLNLIA